MTNFLIAFIIWAVLHSLTAAQTVKVRFRAWMGERRFRAFYRLGYTVFATLTFLPVFYFYWRMPDMVVWRVPFPFNWAFIGLQAIGALGLTASILQTRGLSFLGIRQALDYVNGRQDLSTAGLGEELVVDGVYKWMRHPLYTFSMMVLWFTPVMTRNFLVLAAAVSAYFIIGSFFEERRLRDDFGDDYARYQRQVPRFIPRPWG